MIGKQKICVFLIVTMLLFIITGCSAPADPDVEISIEKDAMLEEHITITGIKDEGLVITVEEIQALNAVKKEVTSVNSSGEEKTFSVTGALLEEILVKQGTSQKDLTGIRLVAGDGYSIEVPKEILDKRDILLVYEVDDAPLGPKEKPIRIIIPEERAMYWVSNLATIEILETIEQAETNKIIFLETVKETISLEDYPYYDSTDKAIKTQALLEQLEGDTSSQSIYIKAVDGLEKNETFPIFKEAYIKVTGADAPAFLSPDMPKGMHVKDILYFSHASTAWVSYDQTKEMIEIKVLNGHEGILIEEILKEIGVKKEGTYILTAIDGYTIEVNGSDLKNGILYEGEEGQLSTFFEGLPKNTGIKGLLSIEAKTN
ncbi:molybdopterin-dependent oxidoreductase [Clostridium formicaceticum]|uniref:Oxidoreductase molybdopterin binding domain protein n=1 Tax=Clostridium formicaceticum TaxID=1497 RepID=A0AAC9WFD6_9CLOT|nr:molybdopterin-dependent oxidoreductase [Clostridium formicaceticum]AOY76268.1 hypothetical protein BJL90_10360 [Clostridium formicaceticum]ARE86653.1 Oxidoreductase molybdopterin binding domain protein [Clostridium formicaceticum]